MITVIAALSVSLSGCVIDPAAVMSVLELYQPQPAPYGYSQPSPYAYGAPVTVYQSAPAYRPAQIYGNPYAGGGRRHGPGLNKHHRHGGW
jgi:hypothetical protein